MGHPPPRQLDRQFPRSGCARGLSADDSANDIAPTAHPAHLLRAELIQNLQQSRDRHLIIVRYGILHPLDDEWVYNDADIDGSTVV